jgi:hypothetical protein
LTDRLTSETTEAISELQANNSCDCSLEQQQALRDACNARVTD